MSFDDGSSDQKLNRYLLIREKARQIAAIFPHADFYQDLSWAVKMSRSFFDSDPVVRQLNAEVAELIDNDFGHGMKHAVKVSLDAGALIIAECRLADVENKHEKRRLRMVQCAGLLHDIRRKDKNHAVEGAVYAKKILIHHPFSAEEIEDISQAIRNHEAFKNTIKINTVEGLLLSDCLYDADKFRWGPDNFKDTVWDMLIFSRTPFSKFLDIYPKGMEKVRQIKYTFRSTTGKKYGPQFIETGLAIGRKLHNIIIKEFGDII